MRGFRGDIEGRRYSGRYADFQEATPTRLGDRKNSGSERRDLMSDSCFCMKLAWRKAISKISEGSFEGDSFNHGGVESES